MAHLIALCAAVFGLWLLLSGHYTPLFLFLGAVSTGVSVWFALRMEIADHEGVPVVHVGPRLLTYIPWLIWEVFRSNVAVAAIVMSPTMRITPVVTHFRAKQRTALGRVIMANSVTMTPGTITVAVAGDRLHIHALYRGAIDGIEEGPMNRRVAALERAS